MSEINYALRITESGTSIIESALLNSEVINLTDFCLGNGIWSESEEPQALKNEVSAIPLNKDHGSIDSGNVAVISGTIPFDEGGFTLSEVSIKTEDGATFAIMRYPRTYLPTPEEIAVAVDRTIDFYLNVGVPDLIEIPFNPAVSATQSWVSAEVSLVRSWVDDKLSTFRSTSDSNYLGKNSAAVDSEKLGGLAASSYALKSSAYTHPASHPASMITESDTKRFTTSAQQAIWDSKLSASGTAANSSKLQGKSAAEFAPSSVMNDVSQLMALMGDLSDTTLDTLPEIVAYIKQNRVDIQSAAPSWNSLSGKPDQATRWPRYDEITNLPATYPPESHDHNSEYLGKTATASDSSKLGGKLASLYALSSEIPSEAVPYSHPASHPASMITESSSKQFVSSSQKTEWSTPASWSEVQGKPDYATRWPEFSELTNIPASFNPKSHTHTENVSKVTRVISTINLSIGGASFS